MSMVRYLHISTKGKEKFKAAIHLKIDVQRREMLREGKSNSVLEPASEVDCSIWGWLESASIVDWQAGPTSRPQGILGTDDKKAWTPGLNVLGTVMCAPVLNHLRREQNAPGAHNVIHPGCGGAVHYFWMLRRILPVSQNTNHSSWGGQISQMGAAMSAPLHTVVISSEKCV